MIFTSRNEFDNDRFAHNYGVMIAERLKAEGIDALNISIKLMDKGWTPKEVSAILTETGQSETLKQLALLFEFI